MVKWLVYFRPKEKKPGWSLCDAINMWQSGPLACFGLKVQMLSPCPSVNHRLQQYLQLLPVFYIFRKIPEALQQAWCGWKRIRMQGSWFPTQISLNTSLCLCDEMLCTRCLKAKYNGLLRRAGEMYLVLYSAWKFCYSVCTCIHSLSHVWLFVMPRTVALWASLSIEFSREEYWSGQPIPSPGDLPGPDIKLEFPSLAGGFFTTEPPSRPSATLHVC